MASFAIETENLGRIYKIRGSKAARSFRCTFFRPG